SCSSTHAPRRNSTASSPSASIVQGGVFNPAPARSALPAAQQAAQDAAHDLVGDRARGLLAGGLDHPLAPAGAEQHVAHRLAEAAALVCLPGATTHRGRCSHVGGGL